MFVSVCNCKSECTCKIACVTHYFCIYVHLCACMHACARVSMYDCVCVHVPTCVHVLVWLGIDLRVWLIISPCSSNTHMHHQLFVKTLQFQSSTMSPSHPCIKRTSHANCFIAAVLHCAKHTLRCRVCCC